MTRSLAFRALDRHVVDGRADEPALLLGDAAMSYAQLLHESASFASGLRELGLTTGAPVRIDVPERAVLVVSVLAIVRLGAEPDDSASFRIAGDPAEVLTSRERFDYDLVLRAGRVDPASAPAGDPDGYADRLVDGYGDILIPLLSGRALT